MKSQEQAEADRREIAHMLNRIRTWLNGPAPASHNSWDYVKSDRFNKAVEQGMKITKSLRPTLKKVREVHNLLGDFYLWA